MRDVLTITNDGPRVIASNYWDTEVARAGKLYLSINAGAFRLLVPDALVGAIPEMRTAKHVVISRGPWEGWPDSIELLFDDAGAWICSVWTRGPSCALERTAYYRRSQRLPDLRPWTGTTH